MTATTDLLTETTRRDRWGRYLVLPPNGSKPTGYTRATTIAKILDDQGGLMNWRSRMVLLGLVKRSDLYATAATADENDKGTLDKLCDKAAEAGGATIRRDLGTAFHSILEKFWTDPNYEPPAQFAADVQAVADALQANGLRVVDGMNEQIVVNDALQIAGTFDLLVQDADGVNYVADIKTGSSVQFGQLAFAIQLAIYANADAIYKQGAAADGSDDERLPLPNIDKTAGIILHVQPTSGICDLYKLDLTVGAEALKLALAVRDARKAKPLTKYTAKLVQPEPIEIVRKHFGNVTDVTAENSDLVSDDWRDWARVCIGQIIDEGHKDAMRKAWPAGVPTLASGEPITTEQGKRLAEAIAEIGKEFQLPFFPPEPRGPDWQDEPLQKPPVKTKQDEGAMVTKTDLENLAALVKSLDPAEKKWLDKWSRSCAASGVSIALNGEKGIPSERRVAICKLLTMLAPLRDDEILNAVIVETGGDAKKSTTKQLGAMTYEQATQGLQVAQQIADGTAVLLWQENGTVEISRPNN